MLSIVIGDSPDHLINLTNIRNIMTTFTHTMKDNSSIYDIESGSTLTTSNINDLIDWIDSMVNILTLPYEELNDSELVQS